MAKRWWLTGPRDDWSSDRGTARLLLARKFALAAAALSCVSCTEMGDLAFAPVATSGFVGDSFRTRQFGEEERNITNVAEASIGATSYLWQPWFVTVNGDANLAVDTQRGGSFGGSSDALRSSGAARLGVLPLSNYPTDLAYERTDSRVDAVFGGSDFTSDRFSINSRQVISTDLRTTAGASYETVDQPSFGEELRRRARFSAAKAFETDSLSVSLDYSDQAFDSIEDNDINEQSGVGTVTFVASPLEDVTTNSSTTFLYESDDAVTEALERYSIQGISTAQWRPKSRPFTVNGALRTLTESIGRDQTGLGETTSATKLATATVGLNYPIRPRLVANAGLSGNFQEIEQTTGDVTGEAPSISQSSVGGGLVGNISYLSLAESVAGFDWRWQTGGGANLRADNRVGVTHSVSTNIGHSVSRTFNSDIVGPVQLGASEDVSVQRGSEGGVETSLSHSVSVTQSFSGGGVNSFARLSAFDRRRVTGEDRDESQLLQFQLTRQQAIDFTSSWQGNMSVQGSRRTLSRGETDVTVSASGNLVYQAADLFGVDTLSFTSTLSLDALGLEDVIGREESERPRNERFRSEWLNRLDYRIGRIVISLEASAFYQREELGNLVFLRARREFGGGR